MPKGRPPAPASAAAPHRAEVPPPAAPNLPSAPNLADPPPVAKSLPSSTPDDPVPAGMMRVLIESDPAGAVIVVADRIVGHAPVAVDFPVTMQGYFADRVVIRARFLGSTAGQESVSVKELYEPVDRVPRSIRFTPSGASRVAQ